MPLTCRFISYRRAVLAEGPRGGGFLGLFWFVTAFNKHCVREKLLVLAFTKLNRPTVHQIVFVWRSRDASTNIFPEFLGYLGPGPDLNPGRATPGLKSPGPETPAAVDRPAARRDRRVISGF